MYHRDNFHVAPFNMVSIVKACLQGPSYKEKLPNSLEISSSCNSVTQVISTVATWQQEVSRVKAACKVFGHQADLINVCKQ